jgi:hypothetical protein
MDDSPFVRPSPLPSAPSDWQTELFTFLKISGFPEVMDRSTGEPLDPLLWYKTVVAPMCPRVAQLARRVLGTLASQVACESAFSKSGQILSNRRLSMNSDLTEDLVICHVNEDLF